MAEKDTAVLRDFVYLDWERIRSMTAQLFRGVPLDTTDEKGHEITGRGSLEGSLLTLIKAQGGADYRYFRTGNETRSFHHYVYSLLEDRLLEDGLVTGISTDFDYDRWTEEFFYDGQFIRVTGLVRLMDYAWVSKMMEALPKMMRTVQHMESLSMKQMRASGLIDRKTFEDKQKEQQKQLNEIKALKMDELTGLISQLYGDAVRVKVLLTPSIPRMCSSAPENLQASTTLRPRSFRSMGTRSTPIGSHLDKSTCRGRRKNRCRSLPVTRWKTVLSRSL